jgi:hypothetical protein
LVRRKLVGGFEATLAVRELLGYDVLGERKMSLEEVLEGLGVL